VSLPVAGWYPDPYRQAQLLTGTGRGGRPTPPGHRREWLSPRTPTAGPAGLRTGSPAVAATPAGVRTGSRATA
jgi:hypothetical protein